MNLDQLLRDSAPDDLEMHRQAERLRPAVVARLTAPGPRPRSQRRRWVAGLAAAAAAATAAVVLAPGGPAVSPAYAVDREADGEVVITINRLEDEAGLETALREHGIDAEVTYGFGWVNLPGLPVPDPGAIPAQVPVIKVCGNADDAAVLRREGEGWRLTIPADSPIQDHRAYLTTDESGYLDVVYESPEGPGSYCAVMPDF